MEHDTNCEQFMVRGHLRELNLVVPLEHWEWARRYFCYCTLRTSRTPRPHEIQALALRAQLWARVVRANPDVSPESAWLSCQMVVQGELSLRGAGVIRDTEEVIEVDFRKRERVK